MTVAGTGLAVENIEASAFTIPTPAPESDGTLTWDSTTIVIVEVTAGATTGIGYCYAPPAAAKLVHDTLASVVKGTDPMAIGRTWSTMAAAVRNQGRVGIVSAAISAVDISLWDLKAKLLEVSVSDAVGATHPEVPVYGSGGFTSLSERELAEQLGTWAGQGLGAVKMKVGRHPEDDVRRVAAARAAIGDGVGLFVDANGAYSRKQALAMANAFSDQDVTWFEEPVSSDDLDGLRLDTRRRASGHGCHCW